MPLNRARRRAEKSAAPARTEEYKASASRRLTVAVVSNLAGLSDFAVAKEVRPFWLLGIFGAGLAFVSVIRLPLSVALSH